MRCKEAGLLFIFITLFAVTAPFSGLAAVVVGCTWGGTEILRYFVFQCVIPGRPLSVSILGYFCGFNMLNLQFSR